MQKKKKKSPETKNVNFDVAPLHKTRSAQSN